MTKAIVLRHHGGPVALQLEDVEVGRPAAGELLIRQTAIGVNFHDVYVRSGLYQTLPLPGIPGIEAVGIVEAVGAGVEGFAVGQRVGYVTGAYGAYAERRVLAAAIAMRLPDTLGDIEAASVLLKGLTACMLIQHVAKVETGAWVLVHAAAGGVGQILCAWARHLGAHVIGTTGSPEKVGVARAAGAHEVLDYRSDTFVEDVRRLTGGEGVNVAYDAIGRDTFPSSLACLSMFGMLVNYGQASGPVEPLSPSVLAAKSNSLVRPIIFHWLRDPATAKRLSTSLFAAIDAGIVRPRTNLTLTLSDAAESHSALERRQTAGSVVLTA